MLRATLFGTVGLMTLTGCASLSDSKFDPLEILGVNRPDPTTQQGAEPAQETAEGQDTAADSAIQPHVDLSQGTFVFNPLELLGVNRPDPTPEQADETAQEATEVQDAAADSAIQPVVAPTRQGTFVFNPRELLGLNRPDRTPEQGDEAAQEAAAVQDTAAQPAVQPLVDPSQRTLVVDRRAFVDSVESVVIDQTPTGAIVRASGTARAQGYFNAQLVSLGTQNGVLTLEFRAQAPAGTLAHGSARSRQIAAAYVIDTADLLAVRSIRVQSATNVRTSGL